MRRHNAFSACLTNSDHVARRTQAQLIRIWSMRYFLKKQHETRMSDTSQFFFNKIYFV